MMLALLPEPSTFHEFLPKESVTFLLRGLQLRGDLLPGHLLVVSEYHFRAVSFGIVAFLGGCLSHFQHVLQGRIEAASDELDF